MYLICIRVLSKSFTCIILFGLYKISVSGCYHVYFRKRKHIKFEKLQLHSCIHSHVGRHLSLFWSKKTGINLCIIVNSCRLIQFLIHESQFNFMVLGNLINCMRMHGSSKQFPANRKHYYLTNSSHSFKVQNC